MTRLQFDCQLGHDSGFALSARFEAGSGVTALFGPSGSGKTTILHLIAGILRPAVGTIQLDDRTLVDTRSGIFVCWFSLIWRNHLGELAGKGSGDTFKARALYSFPWAVLPVPHFCSALGAGALGA